MEDLFTGKELDELIKPQESGCLSIFMPAVQAGPEVRQNPTRFKNMLTRAEKLLSNGRGSIPDPEFLAPLRGMLRDNLFWANQSRGLALFRSSRMIRVYRVPAEFREIVAVAGHFHIRPMIAFLRSDQRFYILALSKKEVRLIECSLQQAVEVEVPNLPRSLDEALRHDDPQHRMLFRSVSSKAGEKPTTFHAHGIGQETAKEDLFRYFQLVNRSLEQFLKEQKAPLIVAAVDYLLPIYSEANTYSALIELGIPGSPEGLSPQELRNQALPLVEGLLREEEAESISKFKEKIVRLPSSTHIREVVSSAYNGRVDSLLLSREGEIWGFFDPENHETAVSEELKAGHCDLLNFAALHTISNGGTVIPVSRENIPGGGLVAALFRY